MRYVQILSLLACAQIATANPISLEVRATGKTSSTSQSSQSSQSSKASKASQSSTSTNSKEITKDSVSRAADNFAQDAGIVSNAINKMTSMTDQDAIKATAQRAFDAESDEDNQRQILAAAAGSAGDSSNSKIMKDTPTVLNGLDAITKDASPESVKKNTQMMEDPRNQNILPSITQLSNAALDAMGLDQTAPKLKSTTGVSGNNADGTDPGTGSTGSNNSNSNNNNSNNNNNDSNDNNNNNKSNNSNSNNNNNNDSNDNNNNNDNDNENNNNSSSSSNISTSNSGKSNSGNGGNSNSNTNNDNNNN